MADEAINAKAAFAAGGEGTTWEKYATDSSLPLDKTAAEADEKVGIDGFVALKGAFDSASRSREWSTYGANTGRKGWGAKEPKYHSSSEIKGQYAFAYALWGIAAAMLVWTLINSRRQLSGDADSITSETGTRVPFDAVFRVDKRKWDNKGLAYVHYKDQGGSEKRLVVDDLKYVGADKILDCLLSNFEGELVERVRPEDDESEAAEKGEDAEL